MELRGLLCAGETTPELGFVGLRTFPKTARCADRAARGHFKIQRQFNPSVGLGVTLHRLIPLQSREEVCQEALVVFSSDKTFSCLVPSER